MRISLYQAILAIVFVTIAQAYDIKAQEVLERKVSLQLSNLGVESVLKKIEKASDVQFMYNHQIFDQSGRLTLKVENERLEEVLGKVLSPYMIEYEVVGKRIILKKIIKPTSAIQQKELAINSTENILQTVTGRVTDSEKGEGLPGVSIAIKGTQRGTTTDAKGNYSIAVPDENSSLIFSFVGYLREEVLVGKRTVISVSLKTDVQALGEVVVVGYGTQKKATLSGAVSTVDNKVFQDRGAVTNPLSALQGQVPGVVVTRSSSAPGQEGWNFQIRGAASTNGADPLVIVDGIPLVSLNALNSINPQDIDNMSFLKDASAAIYGARAAGGVVLITTKKAKSGKATIQFNSSVSQKRMGLRPAFLNGDQYGKYMLEAISNASTGGVPDENWIWTKYARAWMNRPASGYIDKNTPEYIAGGETIGFTDVKDYTFFDTNPIDILWGDGRAMSNQQDISISARTESLGYRLSLGYLNDGSMLKWGQNSNKRYNVRLAFDYTFSPRLKISTNISLEKNDVVVPSRQGEINFGSQPGFPVATINGKPYAWGTQPARNWLLELGGESITANNRVFINSKLEFNIAKDLNLIAQAGYNYSVSDLQSQYKYITGIYNYTETYQYQDNPSQNQSWYVQAPRKEIYYNTNAYLEYKKKLSDLHNVTVVAGVNYERDELDSLSTQTTYLASNDIPALGLGLGDNTTRTNSEKRNHWAIASGFGRFNYDFNNKYLFEANVRYDGSSKFDASNRWKLYGGISAGWRISQENFMKNIKFFNELKIRGSYGTVGNQSGIGLYDYTQLININAGGPILGGYSSRSVISAPAGTLVSLNRTWESITSTNIGLDFSALNNRLFGGFDYYWKQNSNMLLPQTYPAVLGAVAPTANIGNLKVWGWEMSLGWRDKIGSVSYRVSGTLSDNDNKLVNYGGANIIAAGKRTIEGYPLNSYFGVVYNGRIQTTDQAAAYAQLVPGSSISNMPGVTQMIPGINMYKDINGDGKLTNAGATQYLLGKKDANGNPIADGDVVYLGRSDPRYVFAINLGLEWKGFDFGAVFQGVGQRNIYRRSDWSTPFGAIYQGHANWWVGKTWTPDNPNAELPILTTATNKGFGNYGAYNYQISDWSMQNGAYVRLKNLVIGYTIPQAITQKVKIEKLRIYFSGNDLWELTKVEDNWDPEQTSDVGGGAQRYPFYRLLTFGVNVTF
ncbi:TonB-linked outer membrane protein, SusC/RagA family [Pseudarcicella hirudinis]|uniref:TonB-linked outer membrane protein, SusC/RagA family n=1 Tax=Pseudarcicella hirudinis TaxID=1079859 RepID=A0A1I5WAR5_9BACT|nr:TonB-dependent receptor [Pseudarcicella hirudinis]SFQ16737.1 TonB-linked outer membrane protein, SusC/RagA family [Pseudarcicella hirudinis]